MAEPEQHPDAKGGEQDLTNVKLQIDFSSSFFDEHADVLREEEKKQEDAVPAKSDEVTRLSLEPFVVILRCPE